VYLRAAFVQHLPYCVKDIALTVICDSCWFLAFVMSVTDSSCSLLAHLHDHTYVAVCDTECRNDQVVMHLVDVELPYSLH